jgi:competence protein ComEA
VIAGLLIFYDLSSKETNMSVERINRLWLLATGLLVLIIVVSNILIWLNRSKSQLLVIYPSQIASFEGGVYVYGAVAQPGSYTLKGGETLASLVQTSGGTTKNADLFRMHLYIPLVNENQEPQKININRAEAWLLEALPGIGETRAQAILEYRRNNGLFHSIDEIISVPGISPSIFQKIQDFITVTD